MLPVAKSQHTCLMLQLLWIYPPTTSKSANFAHCEYWISGPQCTQKWLVLKYSFRRKLYMINHWSEQKCQNYSHDHKRYMPKDLELPHCLSSLHYIWAEFQKMRITYIQDQSKMLMLCLQCPVGDKEMEIWTDLLCEAIWQVVEFCSLARSEALSPAGQMFWHGDECQAGHACAGVRWCHLCPSTSLAWVARN